MIPRKRIARTTATIRTVGLAAVLGRRFYREYKRDIRAAYAAVEDADTDRVETSVGTVEYTTKETGVPVLVAHGIFGGFDQVLRTGEGLLDSNAEIIGVSRFGYLGSELPADPTPENQARAYVDLLDELGIDTVAVVGTSAGGAPAIGFALDYPDRTRALLLIGSASPSEQELAGPTGPPHAILADPVIWFLVTYVPQVFLALFGVDRSDYASTPRDERRRVQALLDTLVPVEPRRPGIFNDERVTNRS